MSVDGWCSRGAKVITELYFTMNTIEYMYA
jgi:hypothetical protein